MKRLSNNTPLQRVDNYTDIDDKGKKTSSYYAIEKYSNAVFLAPIILNQEDVNIENINGNT